MKIFDLIKRDIRYFRGVNLALLAGVIVATAVLTGALLVGDSVRGSLAQLARDRLGKIDHAILARRFFDASLVGRLAADEKLKSRFTFAPAITLAGGASTEDGSVRAGAVQILAAGGDWVPVRPQSCILNSPTGKALGLSDPGKTVLLSVPDKPDEPRDAALSRRAREDTLVTLRANVEEIHSARDMVSRFNPQGGQRVPQNAWVNLAELQDQIDLKGRVNAIFVHDTSAQDSIGGAALLNNRLRLLIHIEDFGLSLTTASDHAMLTSRMIYLDPPAIAAAEQSGVPVNKISVNLINALSVDGSSQSLHYVVAAGISMLNDKQLANDEIVINQWTADQLNAKVGDHIRLKFYERELNGALIDKSSNDVGYDSGFRVSAILPMTGIGADATLTPSYKGLTDSDTIAGWNPPKGVEIDKKLVTKADEDYWRRYRAAPKIFLSFAASQKLWGGTIQNVTSIRIAAADAAAFRTAMNAHLDPVAMGLAFQPIMAQQLAASSGNTDFGEYFIYFSFFIIFAAVLLVAMLFRLNVEQRARQLGLLAATGFAPGALRRLMLGEGMTLAAVGAFIGIFAALAYTGLIMLGLRTWWIGAVGTTELHLHAGALSLLYGFFGSLLVSFFAILWAVWRISRVQPAALLAGQWGRSSSRRSGRITRWIGVVLMLLAIGIFASAVAERSAADEAFLGGGAMLLCGTLCWLTGEMRPRRYAKAALSLGRLGVRNASRHTARSVLSIGLIAFACFTLVTVAAFKQGPPADVGDVQSGAGGYRLVLSSAIPLLGDLNTQQGRRILGMSDAEDQKWDSIHFVSMRRWAGQDISCLNLTQPTTPTILAVPDSMTSAPDLTHVYRFAFATTEKTERNPWDLLAPSGDEIPVIADANTAQYILHLSIGDTVSVPDAAGTQRKLRLVATLSNSIFQSELLMGEANFRKLFPAQDGFGTVLVECSADQAPVIRQTLNTQLGDYAVNTEPTGARLAQFLEIENTYLSTFQALGALGLMLGAIGLSVVVVRTVIERKAELALLASIGFSRLARAGLILCENLFLLAAGVAVGTTCAVIGIIPTVMHSGLHINVKSLTLTLLTVILIGAAASTIAVVFAGRTIKPADLRHE